MFYYVETAKIPQSKRKDFIDALKRLAEYTNSKYDNMSLELLQNVSGESGVLHWVGRYESMAAYVDFQKTKKEDEKRKKIVAEADKVFKTLGDIDTKCSFYETAE